MTQLKSDDAQDAWVQYPFTSECYCGQHMPSTGKPETLEQALKMLSRRHRELRSQFDVTVELIEQNDTLQKKLEEAKSAQLPCVLSETANRHQWISSFAIVGILIVLCFAVFGCASPKHEIEKAASFATIEAGSAITALDSATATGEVGPKAAPFVADAKAHMGNVLGAASSITSNLPGVKDVEGWWVAWIKVGLIGAASIACFYFLWPVLPGVIAWIVVKFPKMLWAIPRSVRAAAKFDAEALESAPSDSSLYESIAVKRVKSPFYEAAFKVAKSQL